MNEQGEYYGIQRENLLVLWVAGWLDGWVVGPFVGCGVCQLSCVQSRVCWFKANWNFGFTQFAKSLSSLAVYLLFLFCRCQFGHAEQGHITMPSEVYTFMNIVFCAWPTIYREIPGTTVHSLPIISLLRQVMAHGNAQSYYYCASDTTRHDHPRVVLISSPVEFVAGSIDSSTSMDIRLTCCLSGGVGLGNVIVGLRI